MVSWTRVKCARLPREARGGQGRRQDRGVTLIELLLASLLGLVIVLAVGQVDVSRILMTNQVRGFAVAQMEANFAVTHMSKQLEGADRLVRLSASDLQFRLPQGTNFDDASNYQWKEYTYDSANRIMCFYEPASSCTLASRFQDVDGLTFTLTGNNVVEVVVDSTTPTTNRTTTYQAHIAIRSSSSDLSTGLAAGTVAPPPAACPASCPLS